MALRSLMEASRKGPTFDFTRPGLWVNDSGVVVLVTPSSGRCDGCAFPTRAQGIVVHSSGPQTSIGVRLDPAIWDRNRWRPFKGTVTLEE